MNVYREVAGVIALATTAAVAHNTDIEAWWLLPVAIPAVFGFSLWRAVRHRG